MSLPQLRNELCWQTRLPETIFYKALIFFDKLYAQMNEAEKREFLSQLVDNVQIYEERKENSQWLKSIEFKLPIIEKEFTLSLDNDTQNVLERELNREILADVGTELVVVNM